MNKEIRKFLKNEAKRAYLCLSEDQKTKTNKAKIYQQMERRWRAGDKLSKEDRDGSKET